MKVSRASLNIALLFAGFAFAASCQPTHIVSGPPPQDGGSKQGANTDSMQQSGLPRIPINIGKGDDEIIPLDDLVLLSCQAAQVPFVVRQIDPDEFNAFKGSLNDRGGSRSMRYEINSGDDLVLWLQKNCGYSIVHIENTSIDGRSVVQFLIHKNIPVLVHHK